MQTKLVAHTIACAQHTCAEWRMWANTLHTITGTQTINTQICTYVHIERYIHKHTPRAANNLWGNVSLSLCHWDTENNSLWPNICHTACLVVDVSGGHSVLWNMAAVLSFVFSPQLISFLYSALGCWIQALSVIQALRNDSIRTRTPREISRII